MRELWETILDKMEDRIPDLILQPTDDKEYAFMELGDILGCSVLPVDKLKEIADRIRIFANGFSNDEDNSKGWEKRSLQRYLFCLAGRILVRT